MELEELAEPLWQAEEAEGRRPQPDDEPASWASDYPSRTDEDPVWVDAYEL